MGKFLNSIFGPKDNDVIYVPQKTVNPEDSKKELKQNQKLEETIKSINAQKKVDDMTKKEEKEEINKESIEAPKVETKKDNTEAEKKPYFFKETLHKTLTILLIEDSKEMYEFNKEIVELSKRAVGDNLAVIIHYGKEIENPGLYYPGQVDEDALICLNEKGTSLCFYDAIIHLETIVDDSVFHIVEGKTKKYEIENVEIVGFSTGIDNISKSTIKEAYEAFKKISEKTKVTNKCFCISEDNFISLASIGFHSIGRIKTNFE